MMIKRFRLTAPVSGAVFHLTPRLRHLLTFWKPASRPINSNTNFIICLPLCKVAVRYLWHFVHSIIVRYKPSKQLMKKQKNWGLTIKIFSTNAETHKLANSWLMQWAGVYRGQLLMMSNRFCGRARPCSGECCPLPSMVREFNHRKKFDVIDSTSRQFNTFLWDNNK